MCCFCRSVVKCIVKPTLHWFMFINSQPAEGKKKKKTGLPCLTMNWSAPKILKID